MLYIDQHLKDQLSDHLQKNERLIWAGTPKTGTIFRPYDFFMIPFSLAWCIFVGFWMYMAAKDNFLFGLFGIPFAFVGIFMLFGRFIADRKTRANTVYGLTNERILIKVGARKTHIKSFQLSTQNGIELMEEGDGFGTIIIGNVADRYDRTTQSGNWSSASPSSTRLYKIRDARNVYSEIMKVQKESNVSS